MSEPALSPYRRVAVDEFLRFDLGGARCELVHGEIRMMQLSTERHAWASVTLLVALHSRLRGSGRRAYGCRLPLRTGDDTVRFPDASVYGGDPALPANERKTFLGDPLVVVEVLSPESAAYDQAVKLAEYRALAGIREIVFVDPGAERVRLVRRIALQDWTDDWLDAGTDLPLPAHHHTRPHAEIFARD